jgi:hypothetical protein
MGRHRHAETERRIRQLFTSGLNPTRRAFLFADIEQCDKCAGVYRRYHCLEMALTGTTDGLSPFANERLRETILSAVAEDVVPELRRGWILKLGLVGATAFAAAFVLIIALSPGSRATHRVPVSSRTPFRPVEYIAAKGFPPNALSDVGIRVFQVAESGDTVSENRTLSIHHILTFTYTFAKPHQGYLALFGVQETGDIRWYYPDYGGNASIPIEGDAIDEPLGDGIDLSVNHSPGWLRIVALFSESPIDATAIEGSIEMLRASGGDPIETLRALPDNRYGTSSVQYSLMVEIRSER